MLLIYIEILCSWLLFLSYSFYGWWLLSVLWDNNIFLWWETPMNYGLRIRAQCFFSCNSLRIRGSVWFFKFVSCEERFSLQLSVPTYQTKLGQEHPNFQYTIMIRLKQFLFGSSWKWQAMFCFYRFISSLSSLNLCQCYFLFM